MHLLLHKIACLQILHTTELISEGDRQEAVRKSRAFIFMAER